jgi:hypothetical protein
MGIGPLKTTGQQFTPSVRQMPALLASHNRAAFSATTSNTG